MQDWRGLRRYLRGLALCCTFDLDGSADISDGAGAYERMLSDLAPRFLTSGTALDKAVLNGRSILPKQCPNGHKEH
jgi:hypothetical protein